MSVAPPWAEVADRVWRQGEQTTVHLVSDDNRAIASGIELVYSREASDQLCQFLLLQEYRRRENGNRLVAPQPAGTASTQGLHIQTT